MRKAILKAILEEIVWIIIILMGFQGIKFLLIKAEEIFNVPVYAAPELCDAASMGVLVGVLAGTVGILVFLKSRR